MRSGGLPPPGRPMIPIGPGGSGYGAPTIVFRDALYGSRFESRNPPAVARYASESGETFVLDRSGQRPMLKFDGAGEVWVLDASPAPRGDMIYKNDLGEPVLRATRVGGLTVFTPNQPDGAAAALLGSTTPLRLQQIGPQELLAVLAQASARAGRAARRLIPIEAQASPQSAPLVADAAGRAADAVVRLARRKESRKVLDRIAKIVIGEGRRPEAVMQADGVVRISVAPEMGMAGRPSSERIALATGGRRR